MISAIQAANGVRHYPTGSRPEIEKKGDVYELPGSHPGVPHRITVIPSSWIGFGGRTEAVDASGNELKCKAWDQQIIVTDARTGITTKLDRNTLDVVICEEIKSKTRPILNGCKTETDCRLQQHLDANGDIRVRTSYHSLEERYSYSMVRDMPGAATQQVTTALDESYEETLIRGTDPVSTKVVFKQRRMDPVEKGTMESRVDESGDLCIARPDGTEETYRLFIAPHQISA